ncbi:GTP 3',8-cyclase [Neobacillus rhizosphaerae]|uniref:GTP 3',8-cyclase n=1 Tax=Neobacillus rhizosphaerae TaxID=2880965 RepID=A0ABM9EM57_9BACI|nr:radical SAM protein [Neobacillus rhizosphaerae]CAH2713692.1 GTP 3',8-cyclase [Neobacillus rhizosphaerae]
MILEKKYTFHSKVEVFEIEGIRMIGNLANGSIIGLDTEGEHIVDRIIKGAELAENHLTEKTIQMLDYMKNLGFFDEELPETKLKAAYLHLTDRCNLNCIGCYSYVENRNERDVLPFESVCIIIDQLKINGVQQIVISGGEPFIRKDIADICKYIKENAQIEFLSVITNGTMFYERHLEAFKYIDVLNISVDGFNEETQFIRDKGIMKKIISNIEFLRPRVSINLIATIHRRNLQYTNDYLKFANGLGVKLSFSIFTVDPNDELFKDFIFDKKSLVNFSKRILTLDENVQIMDMPTGEVCLTCRGNCEVAKEIVSISADGSIYPCHMLHNDELKLGNLLEGSLYDALHSENNIFNELNVDKVNGCSVCEYRYLCGGGCRGRSWLYKRNLAERDAYCPFIKTFYRGTIKKLKESISN